MGKGEIAVKRLRFAEAYVRLGNATRAAIDAGFSEVSAHVTGSRLLRNAIVQRIIQSKLIRREVHAEQTYRNLILLADAALKEASVVCGWQHPETRSNDPKDRARAIETAGKASERLGKVEGLFIERIYAKVDIEHSLQALAERLRTVQRVDYDAIPSLNLIPETNGGGNGNGNGSGNGHGNGAEH